MASLKKSCHHHEGLLDGYQVTGIWNQMGRTFWTSLFSSGNLCSKVKSDKQKPPHKGDGGMVGGGGGSGGVVGGGCGGEGGGGGGWRKGRRGKEIREELAIIRPLDTTSGSAPVSAALLSVYGKTAKARIYAFIIGPATTHRT